jgi:hypothetical protein
VKNDLLGECPVSDALFNPLVVALSRPPATQRTVGRWSNVIAGRHEVDHRNQPLSNSGLSSSIYPITRISARLDSAEMVWWSRLARSTKPRQRPSARSTRRATDSTTCGRSSSRRNFISDARPACQTGDRGIYLKQQLKDTLIEHEQYIQKYGQDLPEVRNWKWSIPQ